MRWEMKYANNVGLKVCNPLNFDGCKEADQENGKSFRIIHKSYSTELRFKEPIDVPKSISHAKWGGRVKISPAISKPFDNTCLAAIREINKDFWEHISELSRAGRLEPIKPMYPWPNSFIFKDNWEEVKIGGYLWYYDFDNFYPSIAVRLGYVSKSIIDKYTYGIKESTDLKRSRNIALSRIRSVIKVDYYVNGKFSHCISSDPSYVENAYLNIIQFGRNLINHACFKYRHRVIGRDIDNIILPYERSVFFPRKYLQDQGFIVKKYLCKKISHNQFEVLFDHRIKKITHVI